MSETEVMICSAFPGDGVRPQRGQRYRSSKKMCSAFPVADIQEGELTSSLPTINHSCVCLCVCAPLVVSVCVCVCVVGCYLHMWVSKDGTESSQVSKYPPPFHEGVTIHGPSCESFLLAKFLFRGNSSGWSLNPEQLPTVVCL